MRALDSCPSQGWNQLFSPRAPSSDGVTPQIGLRISFQVNPTMTKDSMVGRKKTVL